jgi:hypothetical protein
MATKKVKKFAMGGDLSSLSGSQSPTTAPAPTPTGGPLDNVSNASAFSGLESISQGSGKLADSLGKIQNALGQPGSSTTFFKKGGKVSAASKRADGCAIRGKTRA